MNLKNITAGLVTVLLVVALAGLAGWVYEFVLSPFPRFAPEVTTFPQYFLLGVLGTFGLIFALMGVFVVGAMVLAALDVLGEDVIQYVRKQVSRYASSPTEDSHEGPE